VPSALTNVRFWHKTDIPIGKTDPIGKAIAAVTLTSAAIGSKLIGCLKNLPISPRSRFRNRILDLNQIKSPRAQIILQVVQALLRRRSGGWPLSNKELCVATKVGIVVQAMVGVWTVGF
jgi:hypothetical protein